MYRDDVCAVCGESLPPDHFYCRVHAAAVDDRLHEIGAVLPRLLHDLDVVTRLVGGVAQETWDYLAEGVEGDPAWPPVPAVALTADAEEVDVDVDSEPGKVRVRLGIPLDALLTAVQAALDTPAMRGLAAACGAAEGANATH